MLNYITQKLDNILNIIIVNQYSFIFIPIFVALLGFLETSSPIGAFIPMEVISISVFAFFAHNIMMSLLVYLYFIIGIFFGMLFGYYLGTKYCSGFICKFGDKYPNIQKYFKEIERYIEEYNIFSIPVLINMGILRPFVSIYLGSIRYDYKKFFFGSLLASFTYVSFRALVGFLVGYFGKIIFDYLKIGYKYFIYGCIVLILISFFYDFIRAEKK